ncbi:MAG: hypothetical protein GVX78_00125 [Bacteroidetes bacterium]|jgi:t-SNARE complex subunit (syntaxin)|nr:hypothetical protein [Bacteroidota bacterium]
MARHEELIKEAKTMVDSIDENLREIELAIKAGSEPIDASINTHLTALKRIRFELRTILKKDINHSSNKINQLESEWETIVSGRKLLEEQKKIFKNR